LNGELAESVSASGELPGATAGPVGPELTIEFDGLIRSLRFSDTARSANEISSSFASQVVSMQHDIDINTISLWQMNEEPAFPNRGTDASHLALESGIVRPAIALVQDAPNSTLFDNARLSSAPTMASASATTISQLTFGLERLTINRNRRFQPGLETAQAT